MASNLLVLPVIPVFIVFRDRVTMARNLYRQVRQLTGAAPILIDNNSTWGPFLDWIREDDDLIYGSLNHNLGCYAPWTKDPDSGKTVLEIFLERSSFDYYVVTDDDLDISEIPSDVLTVLRAGLDARPDVVKCGLSLRINDLPDKYPFKRSVIEDQKQYWANPSFELLYENKYDNIIGRYFYEANIDTTFAMYRTRDIERIGPQARGKGLRVGPPYCARHLPWYQDPAEWTEEDWYYHENSETYTYWTKLMNDYVKAKGLKPPW